MTVRKAHVTKKVEEIQDILCNICSNSCKKEIGGGYANFEAVEFGVSWGYGSERDSRQESGHICEACWYDKVFPLFSISPVTFDVNLNLRELLKDQEL